MKRGDEKAYKAAQETFIVMLKMMDYEEALFYRHDMHHDRIVCRMARD